MTIVPIPSKFPAPGTLWDHMRPVKGRMEGDATAASIAAALWAQLGSGMRHVGQL